MELALTVIPAIPENIGKIEARQVICEDKECNNYFGGTSFKDIELEECNESF